LDADLLVMLKYLPDNATNDVAAAYRRLVAAQEGIPL
jgi:hypothetical protein